VSPIRGWHHWGGWRHSWRHLRCAPVVLGWACWGCPPPWAVPLTREKEIEMLREEAEWLKEQLEAVNRRLAELEKAAG